MIPRITRATSDVILRDESMSDVLSRGDVAVSGWSDSIRRERYRAGSTSDSVTGPRSVYGEGADPAAPRTAR
ncbi:hypothetical protein GCM10009722_14210 [Williamsia deligens]